MCYQLSIYKNKELYYNNKNYLTYYKYTTRVENQDEEIERLDKTLSCVSSSYQDASSNITISDDLNSTRSMHNMSSLSVNSNVDNNNQSSLRRFFRILITGFVALLPAIVFSIVNIIRGSSVINIMINSWQELLTITHNTICSILMICGILSTIILCAILVYRSFN